MTKPQTDAENAGRMNAGPNNTGDRQGKPNRDVARAAQVTRSSLRTLLRMEPGNVITFAVGLLFIAGAIFFYTSRSHFVANAREAAAVVTDVAYEAGMKKGRAYPTVRFLTEDGREVRVTPHEHHSVRTGETVQLVYNAAKPQEIEIGTLERYQRRRLVISTLSALIGLAVCAMGIGLDSNTLKWRL